MDQGIIFNIQKFSLHDGPGIRTTVFLKGCPLKCAWCSNPESQLTKVQILYDQNNCHHCHQCIDQCPQHAISTIGNQIVIDHNKCSGCMHCVNTCYNKALSYEGEYKKIDEIVRICLQDQPFYEESGGGITISGGEGMAQPQFLENLIVELKKHDLHIAIETTGYVDAPVFQKLARQLDLLLFDLKHYDSTQHYLKTGVHNELIIENLKWALQNTIEVLPRIPVIPDFNATLKDAIEFARLLMLLKVKRVQLLPFHQFGEKKYEQLNRSYLYKNKKALHPEDLLDYQQIFIEQGIDCFF